MEIDVKINVYQIDWVNEDHRTEEMKGSDKSNDSHSIWTNISGLAQLTSNS